MRRRFVNSVTVAMLLLLGIALAGTGLDPVEVGCHMFGFDGKNVTQSMIRKAYRKVTLSTHPDTQRGCGSSGQWWSQQDVNAAKDALIARAGSNRTRVNCTPWSDDLERKWQAKGEDKRAEREEQRRRAEREDQRRRDEREEQRRRAEREDQQRRADREEQLRRAERVKQWCAGAAVGLCALLFVAYPHRRKIRAKLCAMLRPPAPQPMLPKIWGDGEYRLRVSCWLTERPTGVVERPVPNLNVAAPSGISACPHCGKDDFVSRGGRGSHVTHCRAQTERFFANADAWREAQWPCTD